MEQMACLAGREFHNVVRDKATMGARFGLTIGLGLVTGGIFWQVGDQEEKTYDLQVRGVDSCTSRWIPVALLLLC